jgi:hypothetical protein
MHKKGLMTGIVLGALAVGVWYWMKKSKTQDAASGVQAATPTDSKSETKSFVGENVIKTSFVEEGFTEATLRDFKIVMPPVHASKKVMAKAQRLTDGRYAIINNNIKPPVYL